MYNRTSYLKLFNRVNTESQDIDKEYLTELADQLQQVILFFRLYSCKASSTNLLNSSLSSTTKIWLKRLCNVSFD